MKGEKEMNKTKRIVSTLVLLTLLCALFAVLPAVATETDGNLLTNGALADEDGNGTPDGWSLFNASSLITPETAEYTTLKDWSGNYVRVNSVKNSGLEQSIRNVELGELYKLSALYASTDKNFTWDLAILYYSDADAKGKVLDATAPVVLEYTNSVTEASWISSNFIATDEAIRGETVFKMPTIKEGTLPEGASIGLRIRPRSTDDAIDICITDIKLEKTDNWLVNGGFESGMLGWTALKPSGTAATATLEVAAGNNAPEGERFVSVQDDKAKAFVTQKVQLEAGRNYRFSFWFTSPDGEQAARGAVSDSASSAQYLAHPTAGKNVTADNVATAQNVWRQYTYYITVPETITMPVAIRLWPFNCSLRTLYFDDVQLCEVEKEGDVRMYSTDAKNEALQVLPAAGSTVKVRGIKTTTLEKDSADIMVALYKKDGDKKQVVDIKVYGGTEQERQGYNTAMSVKATANFIEFSKEYTLPSTLEANTEYELKAFAWDASGGLKPISAPYTVRTAAK